MVLDSNRDKAINLFLCKASEIIQCTLHEFKRKCTAEQRSTVYQHNPDNRLGIKLITVMFRGRLTQSCLAQLSLKHVN